MACESTFNFDTEWSSRVVRFALWTVPAYTRTCPVALQNTVIESPRHGDRVPTHALQSLFRTILDVLFGRRREASCSSRMMPREIRRIHAPTDGPCDYSVLRVCRRRVLERLFLDDALEKPRDALERSVVRIGCTGNARSKARALARRAALSGARHNAVSFRTLSRRVSRESGKKGRKSPLRFGEEKRPRARARLSSSESVCGLLAVGAPSSVVS